MSLVTLAKTLLCSNQKTYRYILVLNVIGHIRPQGKEVNMLFSGCNLQGFLVVGFPSSPRSTTIITPRQHLPTNHNARNVDRPESPDVTRYVLWHVKISTMELICTTSTDSWSLKHLIVWILLVVFSKGCQLHMWLWICHLSTMGYYWRPWICSSCLSTVCGKVSWLSNG